MSRRPSAPELYDAAKRLRGRIERTPLTRSAWLSDLMGAEVWLKLESRQVEGSFKARGAYNALLAAPVTHAITASAGNHGRALARAARDLGVSLTVFAPRTAPRAKLDPIRAHGATLELRDSYDEAEIQAVEYARSNAVPYISPYNHPDIIAGAGTVALEVLEDLARCDVVLVAVGGGGLVSGIAIAAGAHGAGPVVHGVEAVASPVFSTALAHGALTPVRVSSTLADGLAGNAEPGSVTFEIVRDLGVAVTSVDESAIEAAMRGLREHEGEIAEGAGAVTVAALLSGGAGGARLPALRGKRVVAVVSGGNVDR